VSITSYILEYIVESKKRIKKTSYKCQIFKCSYLSNRKVVELLNYCFSIIFKEKKIKLYKQNKSKATININKSIRTKRRINNKVVYVTGVNKDNIKTSHDN
jgi:hypothetical protein